jgi:hypothetical protein
MLPIWSLVTHSETDGHERVVSKAPRSIGVLVHALMPAVGSVAVMTFRAKSTATHCETDGHETAQRTFPGSMLEFVHVLAPPVGLVDVRALPPRVDRHAERD